MSLPPYFGGSGANLGTVRALSPQTFDAFVKETLGNPAIIATMTRRDFLEKPKPERDRIKKVAYFVPSSHRGSPIRRALETAAHCNLVCIDIDDPEHARPFVLNPQSLKDALHPYAFAAYTTATSTPEAPRLRVVVKAEMLSLDTYPKAVAHVGGVLLGLPEVTTESKVAVQPMFLPTLFCDDDPVACHPLIVAVPEGAAVTAAVVAGDAAPSVRPASADDDPEDASLEALSFLRPPVDGVTLQDAEDAVTHLDPDCPYYEWISVAAALKHQFSEAGFAVFLDWSAKGEKYTSEEDVRAKWDSFKANPKGRLPVTIRSLFKKAAEAGWNKTEAVATRCYTETRGWLLTCDKAQELMEQGIPRISGTPLISDLQRNALLSCLHDSLRRAGVAVTRTDLRKSLDRFERRVAKMTQVEKQLKATPDAEMPAWARGFCYVATQNQFFQRHTGRQFKPEVFDNFFAVQLMTSADEASAAPAVRPRDFMLNTMRCPRVDDYGYNPSVGEAIYTEGHKRIVNLYIPTHPESSTDAEATNNAGHVLVRHVHKLIREPEYAQTLLDFMAFQVQNPGHKVRWAPVIQGVQGCGKTALLEVMRAVLGKEHARQVGPDLVLSGYNGWAFGAQLVGIEEIRIVGHNRHAVMDVLKPCISNDYISVNDKWVVPFQTKNFTNYMMFTNYHDALSINRDERRYFVLFSPMQSRPQVLALGEGYFDRLFEVVKTQAAELRAFLEKWPISKSFNPDGQAPVTVYMEEMVKLAGSPLQSAIIDLLHDNKHVLVQPDLLSATALTGFLEMMRLPPFSDQAVASILRELGYVRHDRITIAGNYHSVYYQRNAEFKDPSEVLRERLAASEGLD